MSEAYINSYAVVDIDIRNREGVLVDPDGDVLVEVYDYNKFNPDTNSFGSAIKEGLASQRQYGPSFADGRWFFELGPEETDHPTTLRVSWSYSVSGFQRRGETNVFVNVPYATLEDIRRIDELNEYSDQEIMTMERLVSRIIDVYCGQSFGYENGVTKIAIGNDSDFLWLPARIWHLDEVRVLDDYAKAIRDPQGNIIGINYDQRSIKEYVVLDAQSPWRLRNRRNFDYISMSEVDSRKFFKSGFIYGITGNWGYPYVPQQINEAARILVKTYFYDDSTYRDRYISTIRAGNWRMEFTATGDETTGSANADMILSAYKNINAAVI